MTERSRRVVLLIDYDNLQICAARDTPGRDLQLTPVVQLAQRYGTVILARAYAEWNLSTERLAVYKAAIEPAFAPVLRTESDRSGKSLADTVMVAEGMDMLWTLSPDVVVLATSDKDLIPLVRVAKQRGAFVVVLGSDFTAIPLREMADEHITYRQCITDAGGRPGTEAGAGRQPAALPEPTRRRRDRNGRERAAAAAPAPPAAPSPRVEREQAPPQRVEREQAPPSRVEREQAAAPTAEPVAPVAAGAAAESEAQAGTRRRRRRGSRRRLERLSPSGEAIAAGEPTNGAATAAEPAAVPEDVEDEVEEELEEQVEEITPTTSAVDEAEATTEAEEAAPLVGSAPSAEPAAPEAVEAPAAPRERRRRTRRTPAAAEAAAEEPSAPETAEAPAAPASASDAPPQSADVTPAPEPASANGEEPAAAPRPRARRVASASRGRTRRV